MKVSPRGQHGNNKEEEEKKKKEKKEKKHVLEKNLYRGVLSKNGHCSNTLYVSDIRLSLHLFCLFLSVCQPSCNPLWLTGLKAPTN